MELESLRIVHCLIDDKFIDNIIDVFEYIRNNHGCLSYYLIVTNKESPELKLIKRNADKISFVSHHDFLSFLDNHSINMVLLHGIGSLFGDVIKTIPVSVQVVWKGWGYDIYRHPTDFSPLIKVKLYHSLTRILWFSDYNSLLTRLKIHIYYLLHRKEYQNTIARMDYFSGVIEEEYDLLNSKKYHFFRAKPVFCPYTSITAKLSHNAFDVLGNDIILGNSASPSMNHCDIIKKLSSIDLHSRNVIMPLSYGGTCKYVLGVKKYLGKRKELNVRILDKFLPYDEYSKLLMSCGFAIYGNEQQAAMGNIYDSIYIGRKVYLSKTSLVYKHLKCRGFIVFSIQDDLTIQSLSQQLSIQEKEQNRKLFLEHFSSEKSIAYIVDMLRTISTK